MANYLLGSTRLTDGESDKQRVLWQAGARGLLHHACATPVDFLGSRSKLFLPFLPIRHRTIKDAPER